MAVRYCSSLVRSWSDVGTKRRQNKVAITDRRRSRIYLDIVSRPYKVCPDYSTGLKCFRPVATNIGKRRPLQAQPTLSVRQSRRAEDEDPMPSANKAMFRGPEHVVLFQAQQRLHTTWPWAGTPRMLRLAVRDEGEGWIHIRIGSVPWDRRALLDIFVASKPPMLDTGKPEQDKLAVASHWT